MITPIRSAFLSFALATTAAAGTAAAMFHHAPASYDSCDPANDAIDDCESDEPDEGYTADGRPAPEACDQCMTDSECEALCGPDDLWGGLTVKE